MSIKSQGWDDALDAMTGLARAFKTGEYQAYLARYAESLATTGRWFRVETGDTVDVTPSSADRARISALLKRAVEHIERAEPVWVSGDVAELIEYAAEAPTFLPQAIYPDDLFVPHGFCLFARPLMTLDTRGLEFRYRAVSWSSESEGVLICKWSHRDDPDGITVAGAQRELIGGSAFTLSHVDLVPFGEDRFLKDRSITASIAQYESLWRLAQQKVVIYGPERTSRPTWKRASHWRAIKEVTVLRLRRAEYKTEYEGEGGGREMTYRTNTRGHWKGVYHATLGPVGDPKAYRQQWIDEYIRGPEDAPLILKKHAVEFSR